MSRVCIFGDSISWGSWDPQGGGWVGRLYEAGCDRLDLSDLDYGNYTAVYNCGISGDTVAGVLARIEVEAAARKPAVIVLAIAINDVAHTGYAGTPVEVFESMYSSIIEKARSHAQDIVCVSPTNVDESRAEHDYQNADIAKLVEVTARLATANDLPFVDVFGLLTPEDLAPDGLHPGPEGHHKLFDTIARVVFACDALN